MQYNVAPIIQINLRYASTLPVSMMVLQIPTSDKTQSVFQNNPPVPRIFICGERKDILKKQAFYLIMRFYFGRILSVGVLTSWLTFGSASTYYQLDLIVQLISWAMIGGLFAWLIYFGSGLILTVRVALTELILIGIVAR